MLLLEVNFIPLSRKHISANDDVTVVEFCNTTIEDFYDYLKPKPQHR